MFLPLMGMQAQSVLTPQQQLEAAQKQLEDAKKAVEEAKQKAAEAAKKQKEAEEEAQKAKAKAEKEAKAKAEETEKIQQKIREAEAEAERLKAEAARLNAETEVKGTETKVSEPKASEAKKSEAVSSSSSNKKGWTIPTETKKSESTSSAKTVNGVKLKDDPKYLEGAVPTDDSGKVIFEKVIQAPGKSAEELYNKVYDYMSQMPQEKNNIASRTALINKDEHIIANNMDEWIVFNSSFISLDRTQCKYNLIATISDGKVKMTIKNINYTYEEGRNTGFKASADEIITDKNALNKKKTGVVRIYGKFRKKTIDRKDQIFSDIEALVK